MPSSQTPRPGSARAKILAFLRPGSVIPTLLDAFAYETVQQVQSALLSTTDGTEVDDNFEIPAGEIRRILADLRAGGAR